MESVRDILLNIAEGVSQTKQNYDHQVQNLDTIFTFSRSHRKIAPLIPSDKIIRGNKKKPMPQSSPHDIFQIKLLKQLRNPSCGYYALFNAVQIILAVCETKEDTAKQALKDLFDRNYFWRRYEEMKGELLKNVKQRNESWYPWTEYDIGTGIMERSYMEYLSSACPWQRLLLSEGSVGITFLPDFARNTHKYQALSFEQMESLETVFKRFRENSEDYVHAFVIGQTSHWLTIVVNKVNQTVETMLLDSKNSFILGLTKEEITDTLMYRLQKKNKLDYPQWKIDVAIATWSDTLYSLQLFRNCALGKQNIKHQLFDCFVEGFFELYDGAISNGTKWNSGNILKQEIQVAEEVDSFLVDFVNWLENYAPPALIEQNMISMMENLGVHSISDQNWNRFQLWSEEISRRIDMENCNIPVVSRFKETHAWFERTFLVNSLQLFFAEM